MNELDHVDPRLIELALVANVAERESALWSRFTENLARADAAMAEAAEEPFVAGSTGQLTEYPGFKVAARCDELALRLYRALTEGQDEAIERIAAPRDPLRRLGGAEYDSSLGTSRQRGMIAFHPPLFLSRWSWQRSRSFRKLSGHWGGGPSSVSCCSW